MSRLKAVAEAVPDYPGRAQLEDVLGPLILPLAKRYAGHKVQRLLGFWLCWHTMGGLSGMEAAGVWARAGIYKQRAEFHDVFGVAVEEFMPGLVAALSEAVATV
jgi:hypothetical protein